ncbi:MAG: hypothetical protein LAT67_00275 [Balneolales bacterium]|nr:hypothetical protein [Balneolales bacterium]
MKITLRTLLLIIAAILFLTAEIAEAQRGSNRLSRALSSEISPSGPVGVQIFVADRSYLGLDFFVTDHFSLSFSGTYAGYFDQDDDNYGVRAGFRGYTAPQRNTRAYLGVQYLYTDATNLDHRHAVAPIAGFEHRLSPKFEAFAELSVLVSLSDTYVSFEPSGLGIRYRF